MSFRDLSGQKMTGQYKLRNKDSDKLTEVIVEEKFGSPWCAVGDIILFHPYAYQRVRDPITMDFRDDMIVVNDQDVIAVVDGLEEYKVTYDDLKKEHDLKMKEQAEQNRSRY